MEHPRADVVLPREVTEFELLLEMTCILFFTSKHYFYMCILAELAKDVCNRTTFL